MLSLKRYNQISTENRRFRSNGAGWPKISGRRGRPTNHSSSQKTRVSDLSYGIQIWTHHSFVLSLITRLADGRTDRWTNRQTDRILIARLHLHSMQRGKNCMKVQSCCLNMHISELLNYCNSPSIISMVSNWTPTPSRQVTLWIVLRNKTNRDCRLFSSWHNFWV